MWDQVASFHGGSNKIDQEIGDTFQGDAMANEMHCVQEMRAFERLDCGTPKSWQELPQDCLVMRRLGATRWQLHK